MLLMLCLVMAGAAIWSTSSSVERTSDDAVETAAASGKPAEAATGFAVASGGDAAGPAAVAPPEPPVAAEIAEVPTARGPAALRLDVVRVAPDGSAVVAGTAEPGSVVTVYAGSEPLAVSKADAAGNFVSIFRATPTDAPRALTLGLAVDGRKTVSDDLVLLFPEETGEAETNSGLQARTGDTGADGAPVPALGGAAVLRGETLELLPLARPRAPRAEDVSLASVSYAKAGDITLTGFGKPAARLRAYVDDRFAGNGRIDANGNWAIDLPDVAVGRYRLRIDLVDAAGKVASRVETPFQRDFPRARLEGAIGPGETSVVVQPGNNLWTLARIHYGAGVRYTQIFTANADLIVDPDLIYPGQIFRLPEN